MSGDDLNDLANAAGAQPATPRGKRDLSGKAAAHRQATNTSRKCALIALPCLAVGIALCLIGFLAFTPLILLGLPILLVGIGFALVAQWTMRARTIGRWID